MTHREPDPLVKFARDLAAAQRPLDPDAARVLRENLWELYDEVPEAAREWGSVPSSRTGRRHVSRDTFLWTTGPFEVAEKISTYEWRPLWIGTHQPQGETR